MNTEIINLTLAIVFAFAFIFGAVFIPIAMAWFTGTEPFGFVFFFLLLILLFVLNSLYTGIKSVNWHTTSGTIVTNDYYVNKSKNSASLNLEYQYSVYEKTYTNKTRSFTATSSNPSDLLETSKKHPMNSIVTVFYNPLKPQQSVLEPGASRSSFVFVTVWVILAVVAGYFAFKDWKGIPKDRVTTVVNFIHLKTKSATNDNQGL